MRYPDFRELHTQRLRLRKICMEDLELFYHRLGGSETVTRYMLFRPHRDMEESAASISKWLTRYASGPCYHWAIALKETDELIGVIDLLRLDEETESGSFAYMLGESFWGQGYGTEALRAVFDFAFREMELASIEADHMAENTASGAVMRKLGMVCRGTVPGKYEKNGKWHDAVQYGIRREQWLKE